MRRFLLTIAVFSFFAAGAGADIIAEWDIAHATGRSANVETTADGVEATDLHAHGLNTWRSGWGAKGLVVAKNWGRHDRAVPGKYVEFSVIGDDVSYESMSFSLVRGNGGGRGRGHGAESFALRSSVDGFASDLFVADLSDTPWDRQTIFEGVDISAVGTQSGEVTFRMYGYNDTNPHDYAGLINMGRNPYGVTGEGTNLVIEGTRGLGNQAVPEPASLALLTTGALGLVLRKRRRR